MWYTFTDAQSPVPDLSGRNHEGILKGTPTWMAEGKPVGSYYFNGSSGTSIDDSIIIDDAVLGDFNFTNSSSFTIMAWIKPKPVTSNDCAPNRRLIFVYDPYAEGKSIADRTVLQFALMDSYSSNPDALIVKYGGPNGGYNLIGPAVVNDAWQHVAVTRNVTAEGIKVSLYLNGSLFSSGMDTTSGPWNLTGSVPRIGGLYDDCSAYSGGYWYNGSIGDFRSYNSSLSEGELQNIWETTK